MASADAASWQADFMKNFPTMAWILSEPGVLGVLSNKDITTNDELNAALQQSEWYKTTSTATRVWEQVKAQDPASYAQQLGQKAADVNDLFQSMGLSADPAAQTALADQANKFGWTAAQLNDAIVQYARAHPDSVNYAGGAGQLQTNVANLQSEANKYLVPLDSATAQAWSQQIGAGEKTAADFAALLGTQAKTKYANSPDILAALSAGLTTSDALSSYKTDMAKMLNVAPETIDFMNNPTYSKVLNYTDPQTQQSRVMNYGEMENYMRGTAQYDKSPIALNAAADGVAALAKTMGKVA